MSKILSVTVDDHIMENIVDEGKPNGMNKSEWVRTLLVCGWDVVKERRKDKRKDGTGVIYQNFVQMAVDEVFDHKGVQHSPYFEKITHTTQ